MSKVIKLQYETTQLKTRTVEVYDLGNDTYKTVKKNKRTEWGMIQTYYRYIKEWDRLETVGAYGKPRKVGEMVRVVK